MTVPGFIETPKQRTFAEAVFSGKYRHLYYGGAIRGGKSFCVMAVIFTLCLLFPGSRWVIVRKDLPTLRRNIIPVFEKLRLLTGGFMGRVLHDTWTATARNGSQIILFPESADTDKNYNRWRGLECNGIWLEEANELQEVSYQWSIQRAGSYIIPATKAYPNPRQPLPYVFLTSNPAGNWVKTIFYNPWKHGTLRPHQFYIPATPFDNPHLPAEYLAGLKDMTERNYKIFVLGDWDELLGAALDELSARTHVVPRFDIPDHWLRFGAFDWGYRHPFRFGLYAANAEGYIYKVQTIGGRLMQDLDMIDYIIEHSLAVKFDARQLAYVVAGRDAWHDVQARTNMGPTTAERFSMAGIHMMPADTSRVAGLKNLRELTSWKRRGPIDPKTKERTPGTPLLRWFDTPANRAAIESLSNMMMDEKHPEDVEKKNANDEGKGGDDDYDETRYAAQSRAVGAADPQQDVAEDRHPGLDIQAKRRKARKSRVPDPEADEAGAIAEDDLRPNRWHTPMSGFRTPRYFGEQDFDSDEEE